MMDPGGEAAKTGSLRNDDVILKLGPLRESELNLASIYELCVKYAGQTIDIEYRRDGDENILKARLPVRRTNRQEMGQP